MHGSARNRLHGYEVGWFTLLLEMGVASEADLRAAQGRVAQAAIDRMEVQKRRKARRRKRPRDE